ncbi:hypothetical protein CGZ90_00790 [Fictibacillus aquaticus]|uniref:Scaffolding protein n=2 Tax=Fictibacillus aquaticus TaxID=2021314 RepID=A0A235FAV8_9BACL|nr:hypothetical protein CGZ90_00790 [Fictibacillus aquaticus]
MLKKQQMSFSHMLRLNLQFFSEPPSEPPAGDPPPATDPPAAEPKMYDEDYVKKLRDEAAGYRTKLKGLETQSKTSQEDLIKKVFETFGINPDPNLEFEKQLNQAKTQAQVAEQKANEKLIKAEVKYTGAELGIVDPDVAYLLIRDKELTVKEDGSVTGVKEALEALLAEKPYLASGVAPAEPTEPTKPNRYIPGSRQPGNDQRKEDKRNKGAERAKQRHKKEE